MGGGAERQKNLWQGICNSFTLADFHGTTWRGKWAIKMSYRRLLGFSNFRANAIRRQNRRLSTRKFVIFRAENPTRRLKGQALGGGFPGGTNLGRERSPWLYLTFVSKCEDFFFEWTYARQVKLPNIQIFRFFRFWGNFPKNYVCKWIWANDLFFDPLGRILFFQPWQRPPKLWSHRLRTGARLAAIANLDFKKMFEPSITRFLEKSLAYLHGFGLFADSGKWCAACGEIRN